MSILYIILWILAVICFGLGVVGRFKRIDFVSLGLLFVAVVFLLQTIEVVSK